VNGDSFTKKNMWDQVDDFKWLKMEPSTNWSVLQEQDRVREEVWRQKVPGGPGLGIDDILKAVGVR
jgi:tubulin-specific chaperone C